MLKLLYDLKVGFNDFYLTVKDKEFDLSGVLTINKRMLLDASKDGLDDEEMQMSMKEPMTEKDLYDTLQADDRGLLDGYLEDHGYFDILYEDDIREYAHTVFKHICFQKDKESIYPGIWEPSNLRLVYDPTVEADADLYNAFTAKEVCDLLQINRQQLYYYVKTGKIKKLPKPGSKQFLYDINDVYEFVEELAKKAPQIPKRPLYNKK